MENFWMCPGTTPPEKMEASPLALPMMMWYSLMGDSVSTNPVHEHSTGTVVYQTKQKHLNS
jgi:hypothetical protein